MAFVTGTANSPDDLRTAMRSFAIHTLGNFDDLFGGADGRSSYGGDSVVGLKHRPTGAAYLFDVVEGDNMNNLASEHVLVGQLLDVAAGNSTYNPNLYIGQSDGGDLNRLSAEGYFTWVNATGISRPGDPTQYDLTTFTAQVPGGTGPFSGVEPGQALVFENDYTFETVLYTNHVYEVLEASVVEGSTGLPHESLAYPAFSQEVEAFYLGSYSETGANVILSAPPFTGVAIQKNPNNLLLSTFSARDPELLSQTSFVEFSSSMWGVGGRLADLAVGWFPRSGRLNFNSGVEYKFYGSGELGEEYFHMVLQTVGYDKVSHWWMGRAHDDSVLTTTGLNPTGMFLGTTGPHTDETGQDTYQYPFSYQGAAEAFKNPSIMIAHFSDSGDEDTIQNRGGGRAGYGPMGPLHQNTYGPNPANYLYLQSKRYSIQSGFNGFQGGEAVGMTGARARTQYPLNPINTEVTGGFEEYYISPWAPVEATLNSLPVAEVRRTLSSEDPSLRGHEMPYAVAGATGGMALNADGWAQWGATTAVDPQIIFWAEDGAGSTLAHSMDATYDTIEFRVRLISSAVGGVSRTPSAELYFSSVQNPGFGTSGNYLTFDMPYAFTLGDWVTVSVPIGDAVNWIDTDILNGFRLDLFRYFTAPSVGAVVEFEYLNIGQSERQRNARYCNGLGSYGISLGYMPGVNRITMNKTPLVTEATDSSVAFEEFHIDTVPVVKRGATLSHQRPLGPSVSSGLAGYAYKR